MEEIEYLEEYEDLILPTIHSNSREVDGFQARRRSSNMMQDEDSSSIDQDIFESLFDDHSDDESSNIIQKKSYPKLSHRVSDDRASLDSLDMLVKDLVGDQNSMKKTSLSSSSSQTIKPNTNPSILNTKAPSVLQKKMSTSTPSSSSVMGRSSQKASAQQSSSSSSSSLLLNKGRPSGGSMTKLPMSRSSLGFQKRPGSNVSAETSSVLNSSSQKLKTSLSQGSRVDVPHKFDKSKSVATVRPTVQQKQLQHQNQQRRFSPGVNTGLNRNLPSSSGSRPGSGLVTLSARKNMSTNRGGPRGGVTTRGGMAPRQLQRPQTTIVKPEKREAKDPSEDPLTGLDDIAEALLDSDSDSFSLSDISDETLDSMSDLDEDSHNVMDASNDSSIGTKNKHNDLENIRGDTPSPTVSDEDKDVETLSQLPGRSKPNVTKTEETGRSSFDLFSNDNKALSSKKPAAEKVTILSDTLLTRIDSALLDKAVMDKKNHTDNEFSNHTNEDVVAALERELMPFLKKKDSTETAEEAFVDVVQKQTEESNLPEETTNSKNILDELAEAVFGVDNDFVEDKLNENVDKKHLQFNSEDSNRSNLDADIDLNVTTNPENSDLNQNNAEQVSVNQAIESNAVEIAEESTFDDANDIIEETQVEYEEYNDQLDNEVAMEVEVETVKDAESDNAEENVEMLNVNSTQEVTINTQQSRDEDAKDEETIECNIDEKMTEAIEQETIETSENIEVQESEQNTKETIKEKEDASSTSSIEKLENDKNSPSASSNEKLEDGKILPITASIEKLEDEKVSQSTASIEKLEDEKISQSTASIEKLGDDKISPSPASMKELVDEKIFPSTASTEKLVDEKISPSTASIEKLENEKISPSTEPSGKLKGEKISPSIELIENLEDENIATSTTSPGKLEGTKIIVSAKKLGKRKRCATPDSSSSENSLKTKLTESVKKVFKQPVNPTNSNIVGRETSASPSPITFRKRTLRSPALGDKSRDSSPAPSTKRYKIDTDSASGRSSRSTSESEWESNDSIASSIKSNTKGDNVVKISKNTGLNRSQGAKTTRSKEQDSKDSVKISDEGLKQEQKDNTGSQSNLKSRNSSREESAKKDNEIDSEKNSNTIVHKIVKEKSDQVDNKSTPSKQVATKEVSSSNNKSLISNKIKTESTQISNMDKSLTTEKDETQKQSTIIDRTPKKLKVMVAKQPMHFTIKDKPAQFIANDKSAQLTAKDKSVQSTMKDKPAESSLKDKPQSGTKEEDSDKDNTHKQSTVSTKETKQTAECNESSKTVDDKQNDKNGSQDSLQSVKKSTLKRWKTSTEKDSDETRKDSKKSSSGEIVDAQQGAEGSENTEVSSSKTVNATEKQRDANMESKESNEIAKEEDTPIKKLVSTTTIKGDGESKTREDQTAEKLLKTNKQNESVKVKDEETKKEPRDEDNEKYPPDDKQKNIIKTMQANVDNPETKTPQKKTSIDASTKLNRNESQQAAQDKGKEKINVVQSVRKSTLAKSTEEITTTKSITRKQQHETELKKNREKETENKQSDEREHKDASTAASISTGKNHTKDSRNSLTSQKATEDVVMRKVVEKQNDEKKTAAAINTTVQPKKENQLKQQTIKEDRVAAKKEQKEIISVKVDERSKANTTTITTNDKNKNTPATKTINKNVPASVVKRQNTGISLKNSPCAQSQKCKEEKTAKEVTTNQTKTEATTRPDDSSKQRDNVSPHNSTTTLKNSNTPATPKGATTITKKTDITQPTNTKVDTTPKNKQQPESKPNNASHKKLATVQLNDNDTKAAKTQESKTSATASGQNKPQLTASIQSSEKQLQRTQSSGSIKESKSSAAAAKTNKPLQTGSMQPSEQKQLERTQSSGSIKESKPSATAAKTTKPLQTRSIQPSEQKQLERTQSSSNIKETKPSPTASKPTKPLQSGSIQPSEQKQLDRTQSSGSIKESKPSAPAAKPSKPLQTRSIQSSEQKQLESSPSSGSIKESKSLATAGTPNKALQTGSIQNSEQNQLERTQPSISIKESKSLATAAKVNKPLQTGLTQPSEQKRLEKTQSSGSIKESKPSATVAKLTKPLHTGSIQPSEIKLESGSIKESKDEIPPVTPVLEKKTQAPTDANNKRDIKTKLPSKEKEDEKLKQAEIDQNKVDRTQAHKEKDDKKALDNPQIIQSKSSTTETKSIDEPPEVNDQEKLVPSEAPVAQNTILTQPDDNLKDVKGSGLKQIKDNSKKVEISPKTNNIKEELPSKEINKKVLKTTSTEKKPEEIQEDDTAKKLKGLQSSKAQKEEPKAVERAPATITPDRKEKQEKEKITRETADDKHKAPIIENKITAESPVPVTRKSLRSKLPTEKELEKSATEATPTRVASPATATASSTPTTATTPLPANRIETEKLTHTHGTRKALKQRVAETPPPTPILADSTSPPQHLHGTRKATKAKLVLEHQSSPSATKAIATDPTQSTATAASSAVPLKNLSAEGKTKEVESKTLVTKSTLTRRSFKSQAVNSPEIKPEVVFSDHTQLGRNNEKPRKLQTPSLETKSKSTGSLSLNEWKENKAKDNVESNSERSKTSNKHDKPHSSVDLVAHIDLTKTTDEKEDPNSHSTISKTFNDLPKDQAKSNENGDEAKIVTKDISEKVENSDKCLAPKSDDVKTSTTETSNEKQNKNEVAAVVSNKVDDSKEVAEDMHQILGTHSNLSMLEAVKAIIGIETNNKEKISPEVVSDSHVSTQIKNDVDNEPIEKQSSRRKKRPRCEVAALMASLPKSLESSIYEIKRRRRDLNNSSSPDRADSENPHITRIRTQVKNTPGLQGTKAPANTGVESVVSKSTVSSISSIVTRRTDGKATPSLNKSYPLKVLDMSPVKINPFATASEKTTIRTSEPIKVPSAIKLKEDKILEKLRKCRKVRVRINRNIFRRHQRTLMLQLRAKATKKVATPSQPKLTVKSDSQLSASAYVAEDVNIDNSLSKLCHTLNTLSAPEYNMSSCSFTPSTAPSCSQNLNISRTEPVVTPTATADGSKQLITSIIDNNNRQNLRLNSGSILNEHVAIALQSNDPKSKKVGGVQEMLQEGIQYSSSETHSAQAETNDRVSPNNEIFHGDDSLLTPLKSCAQPPEMARQQQQQQQQQQQKRSARLQQQITLKQQTAPAVQTQHQQQITAKPLSALQQKQQEQSIFTPIVPKKEVEEETQSSDVNTTTTAPSIMSGGIPATIVDNSGTRLYTFLHPSKYNRSHGAVLLDYCCPNLDGPMPAIDPSREHAQLQSLVRELPAYIVMTTKVVTRADLEAKNNSIPASIRKKMEKLTSVSGASSSVSNRTPSLKALIAKGPQPPPQPTHAIVGSAVPTVSTQIVAAQSDYTSTISALQKQLPATTTLTPKMPPMSLHESLPPLTPFSAFTSAAQGSGASAAASRAPLKTEFMRAVLRSNLRRFDMILQKYSPRISELNYVDRQRILDGLIHQTTLSAQDVEQATRLLDEYGQITNSIASGISSSVSITNTSTVNAATPTTTSTTPAAYTASPVSQNTSLSSPQVAGQQHEQVQKVRIGGSTSLQAKRQVPIYDKDRNIIGYQVHNVSASGVSSTNSTMSTRVGNVSLTRQRLPNSATTTPTSTLKQPAQESPRIFYTKPIQASTPIANNNNSSTNNSSSPAIAAYEAASRLGRNVTIRQVPLKPAPQLNNSSPRMQPLPKMPTLTAKPSSSSAAPRIATITTSHSSATISVTKTNMTPTPTPQAPIVAKRVTRHGNTTREGQILIVTKDKDGIVATGGLSNDAETILPDEECSAANLKEIKRENEDDFIGAS